MTTFTYHGIQFEADPATTSTIDLGLSGTYRGHRMTFNRSAVARTGNKLRFMGKSYQA